MLKNHPKVSFRGHTVLMGPRNLLCRQLLAKHKQIPRFARNDNGELYSELSYGPRTMRRMLFCVVK